MATFAEMVGDVLRAAGESPPSTVVAPDPKTYKAMKAINRAVQMVYSAAQWRWRFDWHAITLIADTIYYDLPDDFDEFATEITQRNKWYKLKYKPYEWLTDRVPDLRWYPLDSGANLTIFGWQATEAAATEASEPLYFSTIGDKFMLWPWPSATYVAGQSQLLFGYYKKHAVMTADSDEVVVPDDFEHIVVDLAVARLKRDLNYQDWKDDFQTGAMALASKVRAARRYAKVNFHFQDGMK